LHLVGDLFEQVYTYTVPQ